MIWEKNAIFEKDCCIFSIIAPFVGVLLVQKHIIFSKERCKGMTNASLQSGEASLLYLILHVEQKCNMFDSCYILLQKQITPSSEGCTCFEGSPAFFKNTCDILQGIVERLMQLYQWY